MQSHCYQFVFLSQLLLAQPIASWVPTPPKLCSMHKTTPSDLSIPQKMTIRKRPATVLFLSSPRIEKPDGFDDEMEAEDAWYENLDVLLEEGDDLYGDDTEEDWIPDAVKAQGRRKRSDRDLIPANEVLGDSANEKKKPKASSKKERPSPYTEEEEELIEAMGGKEKSETPAPREIGFLGDSTLREIARDYSVPICYLADVLCMWGVPVPINVHDRLGDLVTGEQAFALVEAVNSLDMGYLNDRYSNQNMMQVCDGWDIDIKDAFEFAMKEGWSLPFGVRTNLRVEQEDELLRVFSIMYREVDDD